MLHRKHANPEQREGRLHQTWLRMMPSWTGKRNEARNQRKQRSAKNNTLYIAIHRSQYSSIPLTILDDFGLRRRKRRNWKECTFPLCSSFRATGQQTFAIGRLELLCAVFLCNTHSLNLDPTRIRFFDHVDHSNRTSSTGDHESPWWWRCVRVIRFYPDPLKFL